MHRFMSKLIIAVVSGSLLLGFSGAAFAQKGG